MTEEQKKKIAELKKEKDAVIKNEIGSIFRGHNIMEYKSPEDE